MQEPYRTVHIMRMAIKFDPSIFIGGFS